MAARYRRPATKSSSSPDPSPPQPTASPQPGVGILDILRVLGGILILSSGLSYLTTSGESLTWGYNPWWTRAREWKVLFNRPISLTDDELKTYDGTNPTLPIYLALNGTIYDVSVSRSTYGPGGSYHFFAGRDAARAFLTGCFQEDQTPDLRGVEEMYMPLDPWEKSPSDSPDSPSEAEVAKKKAKEQDVRRKRGAMTKAELKNRHARELREARRKVREGLEHWHVLFRGEKGKKYFKVGEVRREVGWLEKLPRRGLCKEAERSRPVRKYED